MIDWEEAMRETMALRAKHILETMDARDAGRSDEYMDLLRQVQEAEFGLAEMRVELANLGRVAS